MPETSPVTSSDTATVATAPDPYAWLTSVLPTSAELSNALGYAVTVDGPPRIRPGSGLRNTVIGSGDVIERRCLGVVSPLEKEIYGSAPVVAVTFATESAATYGAVAFDSAANADRGFRSFADRWRECNGRSVVKSVGDHRVSHAISDVHVTGNVISAVDTLNSAEGPPVVVGRALGVAHDCIVEVELSISDPAGQGSASERAIRLVEEMLSRVRAS